MLSLGKKNTSKPKVADMLYRAKDKEMHIQTICMFSGRQGGGKSLSMMTTALSYFSKMKIIDFFGGVRQEYLYYPIKSQKEKYWRRVQQKFFFKEDLRKEYKTHYLIPMWVGTDYKKIMDKFPKSENCRFTFFTFDVTQIEADYLSSGYGGVTKRNASIWDNAVRNLGSVGSNHEFFYNLTQIGENYNFTTFLKEYTDNYLFQGRNCPYNLDIAKEIDNKDEITVLYTDHLPKDSTKFAVITMFLRMAQKYIVSRARKNTIFLAREVSTFFSKDNAMGGSGGYIDGFKHQIAEMSKMSRSGQHFLFDLQKISSMKHLLQGSESYVVFAKTPISEIDKTFGENSSKVPLPLKRSVENLKAGQTIFVPQHQEADLRYTFLPRCAFWEEGTGNCFEDGGLWDKYNGNRLATQPFMNEIIEWADKDKKKYQQMTINRRVSKNWKTDDEIDFDDKTEDEYEDNEMENNGSDDIENPEARQQKENQRVIEYDEQQEKNKLEQELKDDDEISEDDY